MAENVNSGVLYITWAESCSRSDHTARELGGESRMIYLSWLGSHPATILFKYFGQFCMTCWVLIRTRPKAVFIMSPPIFAVLPAFLYWIATRRPFVLDCHTAAFSHPRWKRFQWLQRFLERCAATNIVHNEGLAELVSSHGGHTTLVKDVPIIYGEGENYPTADGPSIAAVCSFNPDEPIGEIFAAARLLPDVNFYITGNAKNLDAGLVDQRSKNLHLTGFISDEEYGDLISNADLVMSLTTRDHTMLRGAWEAIYQSTPVVVSDWPCLRAAFTEGALFVDNSAEGIAAAIQRGLSDTSYREGASRGRVKRIEKWAHTRDKLLSAVDLQYDFPDSTK